METRNFFWVVHSLVKSVRMGLYLHVSMSVCVCVLVRERYSCILYSCMYADKPLEFMYLIAAAVLLLSSQFTARHSFHFSQNFIEIAREISNMCATI